MKQLTEYGHTKKGGIFAEPFGYYRIPTPVAASAEVVIEESRRYIAKEIALGHCDGDISPGECEDSCEHYELCKAHMAYEKAVQDA